MCSLENSAAGLSAAVREAVAFLNTKEQERVLKLLSAYARYGPKLLEAIDNVPEVFDFSHLVAVM